MENGMENAMENGMKKIKETRCNGTKNGKAQ